MATARILRDSLPVRKDRYRRADEARAQLTNSLQVVGTTVDRDLASRLSTIHANSAQLDVQSKTLHNKTQQLSKTTKQWTAMADGARSKLKEMGDLQNWAEMIEADLSMIEETLRIVDDGVDGGGGEMEDVEMFGDGRY